MWNSLFASECFNGPEREVLRQSSSWSRENTNQFYISCQLDKLMKGNTQILVCDCFEISLVNKGPIYYCVSCVHFHLLKWHQITWAFFSSAGNFSLKPTYTVNGHYKLGWENAMALVHNVWVRNWDRERDLLPDKYKNLEMSAWVYQAQWDYRKQYQKK